MPAGFRIITTGQTHDVTEGGKVVTKYRIVWAVDDKHGPFIDYFPAEGFSAVTARQALEAKARELQNLER